MSRQRPHSDSSSTTTGRSRPSWTLPPNIITLLRFALLPVLAALIILDFLTAALTVLVLIGVSDFADGSWRAGSRSPAGSAS